MTATPAKLKSGAWGARVRGVARKGDTITIATATGKSWQATVTAVLWSGDGITLVATGSSELRPSSGSRGAAPRRRATRRSEPPVGPTLVRSQGAESFRRGEILAANLPETEIVECEQRQGVTAVAVAPRKPPPSGHRCVAVRVLWTTSLTEDEVEDHDAWSHQHSAVVALATGEDAEPLVRSRRRAADQTEIAAALDAAMQALPSVEVAPTMVAEIAARWPRPAMVHTGAYPVLRCDAATAHYHVPGYFACDWDYVPVHRAGPMTADLRALVERAIAAGVVTRVEDCP